MGYRKARSPRHVLLLLMTLALAAAGPAAARTFYLAPDGDDQARPEHGATFRTLAVAVNQVWGGDTLVLRAGIYAGGAVIRRGCKPEAPLVIRAESPYAVIRGSGEGRDGLTLADCYHVILEGLQVTQAARGGIVVSHSRNIIVRGCTSFNNGKWGIFTDHAADFVLENNECWGSGDEHGIYHSNSGDNFVIRGNHLHHNSGCGIHMNGDPEYGGDGVVSFGIIEHNVIHHNGRPKGGAGINMTHVQDVIVRSNLLYDNFAGGITFYQDTGTPEQASRRALIYGNTIVFRDGLGRTGVNIMPTSSHALIAGNILVSGGSRGAIEVNSEQLPTIRSDRNLLWGIAQSELVEHTAERRIPLDQWRGLSGNDRASVVAEPRFAGAEYGNFHLVKGSPGMELAPGLDWIRAELKKLGGFDWHLNKLAELPDTDLDGLPRQSGQDRAAGAFELR